MSGVSMLDSAKDDSDPPEEPRSLSQRAEHATKEREKAVANFDFERLASQVLENKRLQRTFSEEEVAEHARKNDCWMIIKGKVYDVTPYIKIHPGGQAALMRFAGSDGTENVQFHSATMMKLLEKYFYVGNLEGYQSGSCLIS